MERIFNTSLDFKNAMLENEELQNEFKANPVKAAQNVSIGPPLDWDKWIYRIVVLSLGATILFTIIGVLILIGTDKIKDDKSVPAIITALGSAAIGALGGLLAPSPKKQ